jgi:hypothetical protein
VGLKELRFAVSIGAVLADGFGLLQGAPPLRKAFLRFPKAGTKPTLKLLGSASRQWCRAVRKSPKEAKARESIKFASLKPQQQPPHPCLCRAGSAGLVQASPARPRSVLPVLSPFSGKAQAHRNPLTKASRPSRRQCQRLLLWPPEARGR